MKRISTLLPAAFALALLAPLIRAASCCPPPVETPKASCCAAEPASPSTSSTEAVCNVLYYKPVSAKSLYQLDARWTNDAGQPFELAALRGKPVVLAMFFASCEYACPILVNDIRRLRAALPEATRDDTQIVLVTFDTVRDTPAALKTYRERAQLDANWTLLHGDSVAVQELAMLLGVKFKQDARGQFAHSNLLTVLNVEGEIAHQHPGLNGDISQAAQAVAVAAR